MAAEQDHEIDRSETTIRSRAEASTDEPQSADRRPVAVRAAASPVPISFIGGCVSEHVLKACSDLLLLENRIMHCATPVLVGPSAPAIDVDTSHWSRVARVMFTFENSGQFVDALADLADVVLIDFNRDFCKPTMQIAGRRFSWHYDFDQCPSASPWLTRHACLEDEATHEYFVRWTEAVDVLLHRLTTAGKRVIVLVPAPAVMIAEEGRVVPYDGPRNPIDARKTMLVSRANRWLLSRYDARRDVRLVVVDYPAFSSPAADFRWVYHYDHWVSRFIGLQVHAAAIA
jgi:hypothetical protein